jgi:hypothetical protein
VNFSLPDPLPFDGVQFEPWQSMKYRSTIDIEALIKAANKELRATAPEGYKVFLLAVAVGLRRKESAVAGKPAAQFDHRDNSRPSSLRDWHCVGGVITMPMREHNKFRIEITCFCRRLWISCEERIN